MILNIICDLKSYTSREYTKLSIDSFDPLIQKGYVKEIKLKTYIPTDSLNSRKIHNYSKHLSFGQRNQSFEPTEISLQETHIELWKETKDDSDINWILEHDAYLLPDRVDDAMKLLDRIHEVDPYYANIGLFTCFYRVNNDAIKMFLRLLSEEYNFPINSGPYGLLERLFKTSMDYFCNSDGKFGDKEFNFVLPYSNLSSLGFGKSPQDIHKAFNFNDPKEKSDHILTPITQIHSKKLSTTLKHRGQELLSSFHKNIP